MSGEKDNEGNRRVYQQDPLEKSLSRESREEENVQSEEQNLEDKILSGKFRRMSRAHKTDLEEKICSVNLSSVDEDSKNSGIDFYSIRISSTGSELSELAIHALLVETRATDLEREVHQDPDSDRYPAKQSLTMQRMI